MTDPTTPPTPAERLAAAAEHDRLEEKLHRDFSGKESSSDPDYMRVINRMHELNRIRYAPEPAPPPAGPDWKTRSKHRVNARALKSELVEETTEGSPEAKAVIDDIIAEQRDFIATQPPTPKPGELTYDDVMRTPSVETWPEPTRRRFVHMMQAVAAPPEKSIPIAAALQDALELTPPAAERPPVDWRVRWGADFKRKEATFERVLKILANDDQYEDLKVTGLGNEGTERLVELLAEL